MTQDETARGAARPARRDVPDLDKKVDVASEDSMAASDPPGYYGMRGGAPDDRVSGGPAGQPAAGDAPRPCRGDAGG